jgi:peptide chain release factor 2
VSLDSFWTQNDTAKDIFSSLTRLKATVAQFKDMSQLTDDVQVYLELAKETPEEEASLMSEASAMINALDEKISKIEIATLLSGKYDTLNCIVSLNAGAGGTDAQDWTQMLYRMYMRWFEKKGFVAEVIDETMGEEAGLKSVTIQVKGEFAYGLCKTEAGVHRLVRLSPFNANDKRQTSFAGVDVIPEVTADVANIKIDPKDLRVDTYRASGAGGQHVNKTDSAVRITHLPTGLVAQSQNSRSQGANRDTAMTILLSRIITRMEEEHHTKVEELRGPSKENAWGNQIRSYVFHPYKMVKDLRTNVETSDVQGVMDGDLDPFIEATLRLTPK